MASIYYDKNIYEIPGALEVLTPITVHTIRGLEDYLHSFPSTPCPKPSPDWKGFQEVVEGVDYEKKESKKPDATYILGASPCGTDYEVLDELMEEWEQNKYIAIPLTAKD